MLYHNPLFQVIKCIIFRVHSFSTYAYRVSESLAIPEMPYEIDAGKSSILGKAYQKIGRHKPMPNMEHFYAIENTVSAKL